jgi:membrane protein CcdC involved in cytochrome C biogenesis
VWQNILCLHLFVFAFIVIAAFGAGAFRGFRTENTHGRMLMIVEIILAAVFISCAAFLYFKPVYAWTSLLFLSALCVSLYFTGSRAGLFFASLKQGPIAIYSIISVFIVLVLFLVFSSSIPAFSLSKEGLKKTYNSLTGHDPSSEEKGSFWNSTTGEENPNDNKKNDFWKDKK